MPHPDAASPPAQTVPDLPLRALSVLLSTSRPPSLAFYSQFCPTFVRHGPKRAGTTHDIEPHVLPVFLLGIKPSLTESPNVQRIMQRRVSMPRNLNPRAGRMKMSSKKSDELLIDHNHDGVDRRGFLKCMAWAGTGALCVMQGGVLKSFSLSRLSELDPAAAKGELHFVQISDSHMGFNKPANADVAGTLKAAVDKINALPQEPDFIIHT